MRAEAGQGFYRDKYAEQGWQYGIPEQDGWYWMVGYDFDDCWEIYENPTVVFVNQHGVFIKTNGYNGYLYNDNNLKAIFLLIPAPEVI
ncbi:MAG: hypothetical protein H7843_09070 [Nitrospirota bacterium]